MRNPGINEIFYRNPGIRKRQKPFCQGTGALCKAAGPGTRALCKAVGPG